MNPVVYEAVFSSGRRYVGVTTNFAARRWNHRYEMRYGKHHNPRVQAEYDACGIPVFRALATCLDPEARFELEAQLIEQTQPELNMPRQEKTFTVNGVSYATSHAAKVFGVKPELLLSRLAHGWTPEQAVGLAPCPQKLKGEATRAAKRQRVEAKLVEFRGEKLPLSEHCKRDGITYYRAKRRMDHGMTYAEVHRWWFGNWLD